MRSLQETTLDAVLQQAAFLLVDTNAFIYHYFVPTHQRLNKEKLSLKEQQKLTEPYQEKIIQFYDEWLRILQRYKNIYITNDILDLELGGYRFLSDKPDRKHYQRKYQNQPIPKGNLIRVFDSPQVTEQKQKILQELHQHRINSLIKPHKPGLRQALKGYFSTLLTEEVKQLSFIDQDFISNIFAFALLQKEQNLLSPGCFLTNDLALADSVSKIQNLLSHQTALPSDLTPQLQQDFLSLQNIQVSHYLWRHPPKKANLLLRPQVPPPR